MPKTLPEGVLGGAGQVWELGFFGAKS